MIRLLVKGEINSTKTVVSWELGNMPYYDLAIFSKPSPRVFPNSYLQKWLS